MIVSRHSWGNPSRFYDDRGENTKTERECRNCGLVKVTLHEQNEIGRWLHQIEFWRDGNKIETSGTPVCERAEVEA